MKRCIQIFAKAPVPGLVKTRMQPKLSGSECAELAKKLLWRSCSIASGFGKANVQLWCSPDTEHPYFNTLSGEFSCTLHTQKGEDLGERMIFAMNDGLQSGLQPLLIGADCPFFDSQYFSRAFALLEKYDVALGPATDGGYVAIGSKMLLDGNSLDDVGWGTKYALQQTKQRLKELGLTCGYMNPLADIDRFQDFELLDNLNL